MDKLPEYYVDGITKGYQHDGTLRFEFFAATEKETKIQPEPNLKLLTSVAGFLRIYQVMTDTLNKMEEQGVVTKRNPEESNKEAKKLQENEGNK